MRTKKTELYLHLVWGVWGGEPALAGLDEGRLYEVVQEIAAGLSVEVIAIGGTDDHVHVLARIPSTLAADHVAMHLKAATAQFVNQTLSREGRFRWAAAYAAFTVSPGDTERVAEYLRRQRVVHADDEVDPAMELG